MGVANLFDLNPLVGVNATAGAHVCGPGTSAAFGEIYEVLGAIGASEAGIASATAGLALGSLTGGPVASLIIRCHKLKADPTEETFRNDDTSHVKLNKDRVFRSLALIIITGALGIPIQALLKMIPMIEVPYFIGMPFSGAIVRNVMEAFNMTFFEEEISMIESISLEIFLSITIMTLDFATILHLVGPIIIMIVLDLVATLAFAAFVCFPAYGKDYDAAVMTAGFIGTAMGSGTNAIANQQSVMNEFGYSHKA
ncbi:sodium/glutamate symporter [Suicoccus acidiformans]|uniref:sodium/glutamate symporter n=1 Tax=Suicoccus acidiformans TaxID=2036206 RepID=UPI0023E16B17|nr:sodium/glutamate symporter [Suicoccus acidiformans]